MKAMTVNDLEKACKEQIKKGNGDKIILLSDDDEGNGFHTLFYLFTDSKESINTLIKYQHDNFKADDVIILG